MLYPYCVRLLNRRSVCNWVCERHTKLNHIYRVSIDNVTVHWRVESIVPAPPASMASNISGVSSGVGKPAVTYVTSAGYSQVSTNVCLLR
jgi:hypothetical protein